MHRRSRWHRWKNFNCFVLTHTYIFSCKLTLRCKQSDIVPIIWWETCCRYCWHGWQIFHQYQRRQRYQWQTYHQCSWYRWCTLTPISPRIFNPNVLSGAWGKMIHQKNLKQKILWLCPFNPTVKDKTIEHKALFFLSKTLKFIRPQWKTRFDI